MEKTYEDSFKELELIVEKLQNEDTDIDEAIELFKQGIKLQKHCQQILDNADKQVVKILDDEKKEVEY